MITLKKIKKEIINLNISLPLNRGVDENIKKSDVFRSKKNPERNNELSSYLNTLSQGVLLRRFHLVFGIPSTVFTTPYLISVDSF